MFEDDCQRAIDLEISSHQFNHHKSSIHRLIAFHEQAVQQCESGGEGGGECGDHRGRVARENPNRSDKGNHDVIPEPTKITHKQFSIPVPEGSCPAGCSNRSRLQQFLFQYLCLGRFAAFVQSHLRCPPFSTFDKLSGTSVARHDLVLDKSSRISFSNVQHPSFECPPTLPFSPVEEGSSHIHIVFYRLETTRGILMSIHGSSEGEGWAGHKQQRALAGGRD
ncbi:hypothetical protein BLNAU_4777 [Blattamonas nauphoetae]|uniref:Uncharacterized protein n=1 Tax=Blattamonas nauphoetae TaxID=2049346 RepID=A0ABQ9Y967_9EUKA|nr:hypothetical protein BLNAU_4777 [Blattamonas nauphoetae]